MKNDESKRKAELEAIKRGLRELVEMGDMVQVGTNAAGDPLYKLTPQGVERVVQMLGWRWTATPRHSEDEERSNGE